MIGMLTRQRWRMPEAVREWWIAGALAGLAYGALLTSLTLELPPGAPLNGRVAWQPLWKAAMALLLARAAWRHPVARERRWLLLALGTCALGDMLLAVPWLSFSFKAGLGAYLVAQLAYLFVLLPLAGDFRPHRLFGCGLVIGATGTLLGRIWPNLGDLATPVAAYAATAATMACMALLARLPTPFAALGGLCFLLSDALIGTARFLSPFERYELAIWWTYAGAQVLLVGGLLTGRQR
ncbi:lysoplasmalogenase [Cupriavidus sp. AU9028]|uniref:lysoplasmalogenase n=1 Tax=Cupriavidus sp. AU9028 TaxID=2871157 RepID=UPI001C9851B8|nr:lysoplasmalogenase [Cupriavidus sp. AU9028]MBY4897687.1 lysoplasmalogenase [Cupriavidus sp. AU9028]